MVEEGSTQGSLKELIRDRVLRMARLMQILVDRKVLRLVNAHGEAQGIATGDVAILRAAIELVLLLVVAVDQVFRAASRKSSALRHSIGSEHTGLRTGRVSGLDVVVNFERLVREVAGEGGISRRAGCIRAAGRLDTDKIDVVLA